MNINIKAKFLISFSGIFIILIGILLLFFYFNSKKIILASIENELRNVTKNIVLNNKRNRLTTIKSYLRAIAESNLSIVKSYYNKVSLNEISKTQAVYEIEKTINGQIIGKTGYVFVLNKKRLPDIITFEIHPSFKNQNGASYDFVKQTLLSNDGYIEYSWKDFGVLFEEKKAMYFINFPEWSWTICVSVNIDELNYLISIKDLDDNISGIQKKKNESIYIIDDKGNNILNGQNIYDTKDASGKYYIREICDKKNGDLIYYAKEKNKIEKKIIFYEYYDEMNWIFLSDNYFSVIYESLNNQTISIIIFSFLMIAISFGLLLLGYSTVLMKPLNKIITGFNNINQDVIDLSQRVNLSSNDEIGIVSKNLNNFLSILNNMIFQLTEKINNISQSSSTLASSTEESSSSMEEINANIVSIKEKINILDKEIENSVKLLKIFNNFITDVIKQITFQTLNTQNSSSSIEKMNASFNNILKTIEDKMEKVNKLQQVANIGKNEMKETLNNINNITNYTDLISGILKIIGEISRQTDLLAMNAAIEAAHAGESGRGFSVVADEIKQLAKKSTDNTKDIKKSLTFIIEDIHKLDNVANKTNEYFDNIVLEINDVFKAFTEMKKSTSEITVESNHILESSSSLMNSNKELIKSSSEMEEKIKFIIQSLNNVSSLSKETSNGIAEISIGIDEINSATRTLSDAGIINSENVNKIKEFISKFKTN